jgi:hypothetical protein
MVLLVLMAPVRGAEIIDRILAVVGGELIMLSDATAAMRFGLVEVPAGTQDPVQVALDALVDRQLQLFEVERYLPPEPSAAAIDERMAAVRARFPSADAFQGALAESGISEGQLRSRVRDSLRIASYRIQRFAAALQPTDDDLLRYYRTHEADYIRNGVLRPFEEVRDQLRARLASERSDALINEWLDTLRRRAEVQILYRPTTRNPSSAVRNRIPRPVARSRRLPIAHHDHGRITSAQIPGFPLPDAGRLG